MTRFVKKIVLRRPHLILTHLGGDDGLSLCQFIQFFDHILGFDGIFLFVSQRFGVFPLLNLLEPRVPLFLEIPQFRLGNQAVQMPQRDFAVAHNRYRDRDVFSNRCRVDIDMNDFGLGSEGLGFSGDPVIKANPDGDNQIARPGAHIGPVSTVHADHPQRERVRPRKSTQPHQRHGHRRLNFPGKLRQLLGTL